jgi:four helix bundle protein
MPYAESNMQEIKRKIVTFSDLNAWKEGHKLVLMIYEITKNFPSQEKFALVDQMCRAVVSITSNVAEGFSRQGIKEKIQFYLMAKGSLTEIQNQLYIARDVKYISANKFNEIWDQTIIIHKLITGLVKSVRNFNHTP